MAATTLEKSIFIALGLTIFTVVGLPLINLMQETLTSTGTTSQFDTLVNTVESGIRIVEGNESINYSVQVTLPENSSIHVAPDGWSLDIACNCSGVFLEKTLFSYKFPFEVNYNGDAGAMSLIIEVQASIMLIIFTSA